MRSWTNTEKENEIIVIGDNKILAVVTARANSKGLQGKNFKPLLGIPLVLWSVKAAYSSTYVDTVIVSTNCPSVKQVCLDWISEQKADSRVFVVDRPEELSTPTSKNEEALLHAVQSYEERFNETPQIVVNLQPTSPVRNDRLLDCCIEAMADSGCDSLLTVNKHTPFFWTIRDGEAKALYDFHNRPMRQQLGDEDFYFHDNGNVYMMTTDVLSSTLCRIGVNPFLFETSPYQSLQIDTEFDFQLIEKMAECRGELL
jgi:CMP-N,N'-diacetyllegionaminic acid synthase